MDCRIILYMKLYALLLENIRELFVLKYPLVCESAIGFYNKKWQDWELLSCDAM
jgi:hypothetical protein